MLSRLQNIFAPPIETEFYRHRLQANLNAVLLILIASFSVAFMINNNLQSRIGSGIMAVFLLILLKFFNKGDMVFARIAAPFVGYLSISYLIFNGFGLYSVAVPGLLTVIVCARALGTGLSSMIYMLLDMATLGAAYFLHRAGALDITQLGAVHIVDLTNLYICLLATTAAVWFLAKNIEDDRDLAHQAVRDLDAKQKALSDQEHRYRLLADNAHDFIWTAGPDFKYTYCSPSCQRILGYTPEELVGQSIFSHLVPGTAPEEFEGILRREMPLTNVNADYFNEYRFEDVQYQRKDGTNGWAEAHISYLLDDDKTPIGIVGTSRDITDKVHTQKKAQEVSEQLRQAQKIDSIGQLAGGIAHDFSNMLVAIQGYSDLASRHESVPSEVKRYVSEIKKAAVRAENWTRQLLTFSRRQAMESRPVQLNGILDELRDMLSRLIPATVDVQYNLDDSIDEILGDSGQLGQLIINLCVNARDAMPHGGTLTLGSRNVEYTSADIERYPNAVAGHYVQLCVTDTGFGMEPELLKRIFEPFFTTKRSGQGTGLGLSVVHGIVVEHGGFIHVESEEGTGSRFCINFPKSDLATPTRSLIGMDESLPGGNETILIVEDEEQVRDLATLVLAQAGYTVLTAADGVLGWDLFLAQRENIGVIISDVVMPNMGGRQLLKLVREVDDSIPFIFTSGYVGGSDPVNFSEKYGVEFLQKPFSAAKLQQQVRSALDGRKRSAHQKLVLAVDDNVQNLNLLEMDIQELGHNVMTADNGDDAIKLCERYEFDIIFIDLQMTPLSGIETVRIIRERLDMNIKIIALTAHFTPEERQICLAAGMVDVITKPPRYDTLTRLLGGKFDEQITNAPEDSNDTKPLPIFDVDVSLHLANNRPQEAEELFNILMRELPVDQKAINAAYDLDDLNALCREVHKLHGAVRYCGVPALTDTMGKLETAAKIADLESIALRMQDMNDSVKALFAWHDRHPHPFATMATTTTTSQETVD